ncbi:hypothetical protein FNV43_RR06741 [Rhamnella rubrinervis]|uniref:non-specific serine/threonine protein kinase n=1 Tax=Rhamnella rubrinervis TaxID=2594499 RepID=A0A8K0MLQ9_9ROSA|nr:hypothetical protein FNV43_RR06741 [Rhamnella rubrinervis]
MAKLYFLFALLLLHVAAFLLVLVHAQFDQQDFISIDCGASSDYTDETTGIVYTTDDNYVDTGVGKSISPEFKTRFLDQKYSNLRSFPDEAKNCYTLRPSQGKNHTYLIRASFMYGNYDGKSQFPEFDLYLGVNKWNTVKLTGASNITTFEIIHVIQSSYLHVCLVNTDSGTPFISLLELRPINDNSYAARSGSLELFARLDCGLSPTELVRYKDDPSDRIWTPFNYEGWKVVNTSLPVMPDNFLPPSVVMSTAVKPKNENNTGVGIIFSTEGNVSKEFYFCMHFAEINELQDNETREVNIFVNNNLWFGPLGYKYLRTNTIYSTTPSFGSNFEVWINKTENSTLQPLLNAIQIFTVENFLHSQTNQSDIDAVMNIKSMYGLERNWQGDPCAPNKYVWNGLNCSYNDFDPPRIVSLNLSSSGLTGKIVPYISDLTFIQKLDLSNNSLTGVVPDYLSQLPFLRILNLQGNNLSGTVPIGLSEKSNNGSILLSLDENPYLCLTESCEEKKKNKKNKFVVPVVASVGGSVALLLAAVTIFWGLKRRKQAIGTTAVKVNVDSNVQKDEELETKKKQFTYSEVLSITNNFERVIGKGGFGTVYHGYLNGSEVAAKMLSRSSAQGFKEFQAEAKLLTRVYHRNLTSLVGYCVERPNMGLIYEYMSNGDLAWHLSVRNPHPLNWEERLKITMDAAQGLEYLHNGCKPPMIHRDVKSTNILLNEKLQAKLADFGLSRAFPTEGDTHVSTVVVGTPGYLDPEYYVSNRLTEKSDVFSFGIVILEIITGRPAISKKNNINVRKGHIIEWVDSVLSKGDIADIVDPRLGQEFDKNSVWKALEIAMACVSRSSIKRPTMALAVTELKQCFAMEMARTTFTLNSEVSEIEGTTVRNVSHQKKRQHGIRDRISNSHTLRSLSITNIFEREIGKGGFGTVYQCGYLNDTTQIAVKMLSPSSAQGFKQFHAEAKLLTRVYHRNLTGLVGYCDEAPNMGLVYEYMSNGDLAWHLSDRNPCPLSWEDRLKIAIDAAQDQLLEDLEYACIVMPAEGDHTHVSTLMVGTSGYLDPEYYVSNRLTEKSDAFGFGVIMLEIITGDIEDVVDPRLLLEQDLDKNSVWKAVDLAMACASPSSIKRPTITQQVTELKQCLAMEMA